MIREEDDFLVGLMKTIHELGHGMYEQNLPKKYLNQPVGKAAGMSAHECQSLFFEQQIGSTIEFMVIIDKILKDDFSLNDYSLSPQNMYKHITKVYKNTTRLESDEISYLLHVMMRVEIEKDLVEGKFRAFDLKEIWDQKLDEYLDIKSIEDKDGCMQDIHWYKGYFGYFPSYLIGSVSAHMIKDAYEANNNKNLLQSISSEDFENINLWLNENFWSLGNFKSFDTLLNSITSKDIDTQSDIQYMQNKYLI